MEIEDDDDLAVSQDGQNVRAVAGELNVLFPKSDREGIVRAFNQWRTRVANHSRPRWQSHSGVNIDEAGLKAIVREVTLHWMGYFVMHREPIEMAEREWDQPQTRRIIRAIVERRLSPGSEEAAALCAQLMGISRQAYLKWASSDDSFLGIQ